MVLFCNCPKDEKFPSKIDWGVDGLMKKLKGLLDGVGNPGD